MLKAAWGIQEEAFKITLPLMDDKIKKYIHLIDVQWEQYFHLQLQK